MNAHARLVIIGGGIVGADMPRYSKDRNSYNAVGSLEMARTPERWADLVRLHGDGQRCQQ